MRTVTYLRIVYHLRDNPLNMRLVVCTPGLDSCLAGGLKQCLFIYIVARNIGPASERKTVKISENISEADALSNSAGT